MAAASTSDEAFRRFLQKSREVGENKPWNKLDVLFKRQKIKSYLDDLIRLSDDEVTKKSAIDISEPVLKNYASLTVNYVAGTIESIENIKLIVPEDGSSSYYEFSPPVSVLPEKKKTTKTTAKNTKPKPKKQLKLKTTKTNLPVHVKK